MAVEEKTGPAPQYLQSLATSAPGEGLVLYPDQISTVGDDQVAGFRPDAQALRVAALEQEIPVEIVTPDGTRKGVYDEHAADWVLPLLEVPSGVVAALVANYLQKRLDGWRARHGKRSPTVRYRELEASEGDTSLRVREIEGPCEEVIDWLREERS
jgi:hypothetical protein